jgi:DMSO/TMAO reductase YedYZ molybdopterin-dependent catalytic subunit
MQRQFDDKEFKRVSRRQILKLTPLVALGAFAIPKAQDYLLDRGTAFTDWAAAKLFRTGHLAPTYPDSALTPLNRFKYNSYDTNTPEIDPDWSLEVSGLVSKPGNYSLDDIRRLPKISQNTRHVCIEGWDLVANFAGARISDFLKLIGADPTARFVYVECADDYYESLDMETATHPQSLLCYEMYGKPLEAGHGAPLRWSLPTKIGYKSAKYLTSLKVTNVLTQRSYWGDQGYSTYADI